MREINGWAALTLAQQNVASKTKSKNDNRTIMAPLAMHVGVRIFSTMTANN